MKHGLWIRLDPFGMCFEAERGSSDQPGRALAAAFHVLGGPVGGPRLARGPWRCRQAARGHAERTSPRPCEPTAAGASFGSHSEAAGAWSSKCIRHVMNSSNGIQSNGHKRPLKSLKDMKYQQNNALTYAGLLNHGSDLLRCRQPRISSCSSSMSCAWPMRNRPRRLVPVGLSVISLVKVEFFCT